MTTRQHTEITACNAEIAKMDTVQLTRMVIAIANDDAKTDEDRLLETWINDELDQRVERKRTAEHARRTITDRRSHTATWNVYALSSTGRTLLTEVTGKDAHEVAKRFGRDYMAEHGVRVMITKA